MHLMTVSVLVWDQVSARREQSVIAWFRLPVVHVHYLRYKSACGCFDQHAAVGVGYIHNQYRITCSIHIRHILCNLPSYVHERRWRQISNIHLSLRDGHTRQSELRSGLRVTNSLNLNPINYIIVS